MTTELWATRPTWRQVAVDVVAAAAFTLVALVPASQQRGWMVVATLLVGLAVAVRRASWPAMTALALSCGVVQVAVGELAVTADLGFAPVFFVLGASPRAAVRRFGLGGAVATGAVLAVSVGTGEMGDATGGSSLTFAVVAAAALALLVAGGGWTAGYVRWQNRARITAQVQAGLEEERARIAADMHDLVAHTWAVVAAQADGARYALGGPHGDAKVAGALELIAETARGSITDLRDLLGQLRYDAPRTNPRGSLAERMRASGMDLRLVEHGRPRPGSAGLLPEALTNALKHGDLTHPVEVEEDWRDGYRLRVRNRVRGASAAPGTGHGLAGMRERVERAGGRFRAGPDGPDWLLDVEVPAR